MKPLYLELHAYVRHQLRVKYGDEIVSKEGPIPAHLFGNMWAQSWEYTADFSTPYPGKSFPDVTDNMVQQGKLLIIFLSKFLLVTIFQGTMQIGFSVWPMDFLHPLISPRFLNHFGQSQYLRNRTMAGNSSVTPVPGIFTTAKISGLNNAPGLIWKIFSPLITRWDTSSTSYNTKTCR